LGWVKLSLKNPFLLKYYGSFYQLNIATENENFLSKERYKKINARRTFRVCSKIRNNKAQKKLLSKIESSLNILFSKYYFLAKKPSTFSGCIIDSTKVYAPVFGDFTIFIALHNLLEEVCKDATVFFAIV
jgi:hypothetical protein